MKTQLAYLTHNHSTKVMVTTPFLNSLAIGRKTVVHINKSVYHRYSYRTCLKPNYIIRGWKVIYMTTDRTKSNVTNTSNPIQQNSSEKESVTLRTHINGKVEEVNIKSKHVIVE